MNLLIIHSHNANRGDEAAVRAMVDELLIRYKDAKITISNNGFTPYPNMPKQVEQICRFPKMRSRMAQLEFFIILATKGAVSFTKEGRRFVKILKSADLVLHAPGGPSIGDIYYESEKLYLWRLNLVRRMGIPYMFYAPSMGPFKNEKRNKLRKKILKGAAKVILRDPISVKFVNEFIPELQVEQALDSALQHDVDMELNAAKLKGYTSLSGFIDSFDKCIGITITDLLWHPKHRTTGIDRKISEAFKGFIKKKTDEGYGIVFVPQLYGALDDTSIMNEYMLEGSTFMIDAFSEEYDTYFQQYVISKLYAVVGMRYHSNIFSAKVGTPFISVSYEQKMKGFMESVNLEEYCLDVYDLSEANLADRFRLLEENYEDYRHKLSELHGYMKEESYKTTQAVIDILEGHVHDK